MAAALKRKLPLGRGAFIALCATCAAALFLFVHPDAMETAAHGYLFLESLFSGAPRSFYGVVAAHQNNFYYLNNAHYNIVVYLLYGATQLPVYLFNAIFGTAPNQLVLTFLGKALCAAFYAGCLVLAGRIAVAAGLDEKAVKAAPLLMGLWPPLFFSVFVMGQYDIICLFFMLAGLLCYLQGRMVAFSLWLGIAIAVKSFPAFLFLPLLLLKEKRLLHILKNGLISLWVLVPTSLLYLGHTFSKGAFDAQMAARLFAARWPFAREVPVFALLFILLCVACYFWRPGQKALPAAALWLGLAVFGLLFLFVEWHPQWLVLLAPFAVLTTLKEKRGPFWVADILLFAGFFLVCAAAFPAQLEGNLFDSGLLGLVSGVGISGLAGRVSLMEWYTRLPLVSYLPTALFSAGVLGHLLLKLPLSGGTPAARLQKTADENTGGTAALSLTGQTWLLFAVGFGGFFLLPALANWVYNGFVL